ncbi:MAG: hypothetical protein QOC63_5318 [Mycobacterium sp.]|jgi:hypothetical protein|nr:hypothetical protein [Mycobacterium sp.]
MCSLIPAVEKTKRRRAPFPVQAGGLFEHVRPALQNHGDTDVVMASPGARRRETNDSASVKRHGALTGVVGDLVALTAAAPRRSVRG